MAVQYVTTTQGTGCWQYSMSLPHKEQVDGSTVCHYDTGNRLMAVQYVTTTQGTGLMAVQYVTTTQGTG